MSDLQLPDRLVQLRTRWEADPASRIFLQLSEEYRHLGRLHEALSVLEAGLKEHPGYLSALVAKGRCLLELGQPEPAREVLERVVRQDATQAVANKLLVRAYLDTGQAERAKERLDLYSLLHDGDPEIEDLRGRIRRLDATAKGKPEAPLAGRAAPAAPLPEDPFELPAPKPAPSRAAAAATLTAAAPKNGGDVFQLDARPAPRRAAVQDVFTLDYPVPAPEPAPVPAAASPAEPEPAPPMAASVVAVEEAPDLDEAEPTPEGEPFPGLVSRAVRHRYLTGLAAEGLFPVAPVATPAGPAPQPTPAALAEAPPAPAPPAPMEPAPLAPPEAAAFEPFPDLEPLAGLETPAAPEPVPEPVAPVELFPLRSIGEAVEAELWRSEPEPVAAVPQPVEPPFVPEPEPLVGLADLSEPEPETATVTLADLYLRQGHHGEAERLYQEVLRREPDNGAAQLGLARVQGTTGPSVPPPTLSPASPASVPPVSDYAVSQPLTAEPAFPEPAVAADFVPAGSFGDRGDRRTRTVDLLNRYLERIRRGSQPHVP
jgi:tetratricopeptide (TPR) repeat protein